MVIVVSVVFLQGCETCKGAANGFKQDVVNTKNAFTKEDGWAQNADKWIQENMW